mgnify:CR=1 FL=1
MAGRRSHPPLFEYLRKEGAAPAAPPPAPSRPVSIPAPEAPAREPRKPVEAGPGIIRVPVYSLYIAITAVLALGVLIWAIGFQTGRSRGEEEAMRQLGLTSRTPPRGPDPLTIDPPPTNGQPNGNTTPPTGSPSRNDPPVTPPATPAAAPGRFLGSSGSLPADPREVGVNYLKIATRVTFEETRDILLFLKANGVEALAVRVDGGSQDDNNPPYDLFTLMGVPSDRYSAMAQERERHWNTIRRLGQVWRSEHKGTVDFAQPLWQLFR